VTREELRIINDRDIREAQLETIKNQYTDYTQNHKPLEYILGKVTFFDHNFFVDENTLIPRPETEYMIQAVTEFIQNDKNTNNLLLDV
jgi:release factor glutamine methyltransferase